MPIISPKPGPSTLATSCSIFIKSIHQCKIVKSGIHVGATIFVEGDLIAFPKFSMIQSVSSGIRNDSSGLLFGITLWGQGYGNICLCSHFSIFPRDFYMRLTTGRTRGKK